MIDLKRYRLYVNKLIPEMQDRLRMVSALKSQSLDGMPHERTQESRTEQLVIRIDQMQRQLTRLQTEVAKVREKLVSFAQERLQGTEQICFLMRYQDGLKAYDIAEIMGYTEGRIYQILRDCEKKLLEEDNDGI